MVKKFSVPRGTSDIFPTETPVWQNIENTARQILKLYGYNEIRTPIFEETGLFTRSVGETSDIVQKQMFNLSRASSAEGETEGQGFSLRPEGTASIVRAYIENNFDKKEGLSKLYYIGPMFRGERPQKGRLRQFNHIGVEAIGVSNPFLDAEVIALSMKILKEFGLKDCELKINSLGSVEDQKKLSAILREKLRGHLPELCQDCQQRFERNVFRVLDCKNDMCRGVVDKLDIEGAHLSADSKGYFEQVKRALTSLNVPHTVSPYMVRGLDYYTHTVFEISNNSLGSQDALGAGGRYDNLVSDLGGPQVGAVGFALGIERILLAKPQVKPVNPCVDVFFVALDQETFKRAFLLLNEVRGCNISAEMGYQSGSMKGQMRLANKLSAKFVAILGEDELKNKAVTLKDMQSGYQAQVAFDQLSKHLQKKFNQ